MNRAHRYTLYSAPERNDSMYWAIREYQTDAGSVAGVLDTVEKSFVPFISKAQGFREHTIIDTGNGVITSASLFANRTDGDTFNGQAKNRVNEHLGPLVPTPPKVTSGEVRSHATAKVLTS